jgi:hypothetical protein
MKIHLKKTFFNVNFTRHSLCKLLFWFSFFFGITYQCKDIVFKFIIEYSNLTNFDPHVVGLFLYEDFWKMIFWLVLKLGINDRVVIFWKNLVSFKGFFSKIIFLHGEILKFSWFFFCLKIFFNVNGKAIMSHWKDGDKFVLVTTILVTEIPFWSPIVMGVTQVWPRILLCSSWQMQQTHQNKHRCVVQRKMGLSRWFWKPSSSPKKL